MLERSEPGANGGTRRPARLFRRYFACSQPKSHSPYRPANCLSRFDPTPLLAALQRLVGVRQTGCSLSASAEDLRYEKWKRWLEQITNETHPMRPHRRHRRRDRPVMSLPVGPHGPLACSQWALRGYVMFSSPGTLAPRRGSFLGCLPDHTPHSAGAEGAQSCRPDVALSSCREQSSGSGLVVRRLDHPDDVIRTDSPVSAQTAKTFTLALLIPSHSKQES
jgi:hypothetical protein